MNGPMTHASNATKMALSESMTYPTARSGSGPIYVPHKGTDPPLDA